jgi:hypothetical protein
MTPLHLHPFSRHFFSSPLGRSCVSRGRFLTPILGLSFLALACSGADPETNDDSSPSSGGMQGLPPGGTGGGTSGSGGTGPGTGGVGANSGGTTGAETGGATASGGADSGSGGSDNGSTGGALSGSGGSDNGGTGGSDNGGSGGSGGQIFSECRFHFGVTRDYAVNNEGIRNEIDYFIPGWMGLSNTFDQQYVCDDLNGVLAGKVPVVVAYVAAFYAKREQNLNDCNVGTPDLCTHGAKIIKEHLTTITNIYSSYAQGYANCLGTSTPIIFEMEPDWYQYTLSNQTEPMTPSEAGQIMTTFVNAMKQHLPNARFSMDISPWVPPDNGSDHGANWFGNFDLSLFTFINTSGGGTEGNNTKIRSTNNMTWAGVHGVTGKGILADTGYGVNGASAGHDSIWDSPANINARIADGVLGIAQYNPKSDWGATIAQMKSQLATPSSCP